MAVNKGLLQEIREAAEADLLTFIRLREDGVLN